LNLTFSA